MEDSNRWNPNQNTMQSLSSSRGERFPLFGRTRKKCSWTYPTNNGHPSVQAMHLEEDNSPFHERSRAIHPIVPPLTRHLLPFKCDPCHVLRQSLSHENCDRDAQTIRHCNFLFGALSSATSLWPVLYSLNSTTHYTRWSYYPDLAQQSTRTERHPEEGEWR